MHEIFPDVISTFYKIKNFIKKVIDLYIKNDRLIHIQTERNGEAISTDKYLENA